MKLKTKFSALFAALFSIHMLVCCAFPATFSLFLTACGSVENKQQERITVSIAPLRYMVEALVDSTVQVDVLTPDGASPETYQLTPAQLTDMAHSMAYVRVGSLGFERTQLDKLTDNLSHLLCVTASRGILPLKHEHGEDGTDSEDPHVWMSPASMKVMAHNLFLTMSALDTLHAQSYMKRYRLFVQRMDSLDCVIGKKLEKAPSRTFLIYHPALGYYAQRYGLHQLSVQADGKDPSADSLARLIDTCRKAGVRVVFVQKEYSGKTARLIAKEIGARVVEINPLSYDWEGEMMRITDALCQ